MPAKRLIALFAALVVAVCATGAKAQSREQIDVLIQYYAQYYGVPLELVRRVVNRESTFNPAARNGPYYGLMQILPATARTMGYAGTPEGLLDAETNLIYAVKYLRGAYLVAQGDQDRAVQLYAAGYYYHARDMGLLEETGLRPGPASPVAPTPPTQVAAAPAPVAPPAPLPEIDPVQVASIAPQEAAPEPEPVSVPLAYAPPERPDTLVGPSAALAAIESQAVPEPAPATPDAPVVEHPLVVALEARGFERAPFALDGTIVGQGVELLRGTFSLLDAHDIAILQAVPAPPARPDAL